MQTQTSAQTSTQTRKAYPFNPFLAGASALERQMAREAGVLACPDCAGRGWFNPRVGTHICTGCGRIRHSGEWWAAYIAPRANQRLVDGYRTFPARFASSCPLCRLPIAQGAPVAWKPGAKAEHAECHLARQDQKIDA